MFCPPRVRVYCQAPRHPVTEGLRLGPVGALNEPVEAALVHGDCCRGFPEESENTHDLSMGPPESALLVSVHVLQLRIGAAADAQADALADVRGVEPRFPVDLDGPEGVLSTTASVGRAPNSQQVR